jgi:hypothetical protein
MINLDQHAICDVAMSVSVNPTILITTDGIPQYRLIDEISTFSTVQSYLTFKLLIHITNPKA